MLRELAALRAELASIGAVRDASDLRRTRERIFS